MTGKPHPVPDKLQSIPPPPRIESDPIYPQPPSKRDLASWWRQFKRNSRRPEVKGIVILC